MASVPQEQLSADDMLAEAYSRIMETLVTEDDEPVDNIFSEKQQRLLTEPLYSAWQPEKSFVALANVGLFYGMRKPPLVPDMLLSMGVELPEELWEKRHRSYFVWEYNKPPEVVIEVVSNKEGGEAERKLALYAEIGVSYYAIFDPEQHLSGNVLRVYRREGSTYVESIERFFPGVGLGLTLWNGRYENFDAHWLRWCTQDKQVIPTGAELSTAERERAETERHRADNERLRADRLAAKLRELGIDPDA